MTIIVGETTTEVIVKAFTTLGVDGVPIDVKGRTARITGAEVYWAFEDGAWLINFIQLTGPFVNKDGRDSAQRLDETSHPDDGSGSSYRTVTPSVILDGAVAHVPGWTPEVSASRYATRELSNRATASAPALRPAHAGAAPESITHVETTTQVLIHAYTSLLPENLMVQVKARTARIKKATVQWRFENGAWLVQTVKIWGPVIRQSDGTESTQHVSELTRPASASNAARGVTTPPELLEAALQNVPEWTPTIDDAPYPRTTKLRNSL